MTTKSKKTYIIYACSFNTGNTIYHEMADTKDNAIMRGIDLSRKNSNNFYYLIYENIQFVAYTDSLFEENKMLVPIKKATKSTLIAECRLGSILYYEKEIIWFFGY